MNDLNQATIEQAHAENWMANKDIEEFDKQQAKSQALSDEAPEPVEITDLPWQELIMSVEDTLTPDEVAELTGYTRRQVYTWIREGKIPHTKDGTFWFIKRSDAEKRIKPAIRVKRAGQSVVDASPGETLSDEFRNQIQELAKAIEES